jgi:hypothetical protein
MPTARPTVCRHRSSAVADYHDKRHDLPMTVDHYWRRVDSDAVQGLDPPGLRELVPFWFDDRCQQEIRARITVFVEDAGALIGGLLRFGAGNDSDDYAAWLSVSGADGVESDDIGVLTPEEVVKVAEFLSRADPEAWIQQFWIKLAIGVQEMGYQRPFDDEWAQAVVTGVRELTNLFSLAAAAGQSVIVMVVA